VTPRGVQPGRRPVGVRVTRRCEWTTSFLPTGMARGPLWLRLGSPALFQSLLQPAVGPTGQHRHTHEHPPILDAIPFRKKLKYDLEICTGQTAPSPTAWRSYQYARPGRSSTPDPRPR
jgi:hypothetical protein